MVFNMPLMAVTYLREMLNSEPLGKRKGLSFLSKHSTLYIYIYIYIYMMYSQVSLSFGLIVRNLYKHEVKAAVIKMPDFLVSL